MPGRKITPNVTELFSSSSNSPVIVTLPKLKRTGADFLRSGFCCKKLRLLTWVHKEPERGWKLDLWPLFYVWCLLYVVWKPETDDCPLPSPVSLLGSRMVEPWWLTPPYPRGEQLSLTERLQERPALEQDPVGNRLVPLQRLQYQSSTTDQTGPGPELCIYAFLLPWLQFFLYLNTVTLKIRFRVICSFSQCDHTNESFSFSPWLRSVVTLRKASKAGVLRLP